MDKSTIPVDKNKKKVVERDDDPVEIVEKQLEDLKLNHQFNEKDVPQIFQTLVNEKMSNLKKIEILIQDQSWSMKFDDMEILVKKKVNDWIFIYTNIKKTIRTDDPEKSIIDHLWFVLKNPNTKLEKLHMQYQNSQKLVSKKLNTLLQSLLNSINHQLHTVNLAFEGFNENAFLSMLQHVKPGTLEIIVFNIWWKEDFGSWLWKEEDYHQKMKEIVETDQWKQAKRIISFGVIPSLKIEDLLNYELFVLTFDKISPEDVIRTKKLFINSKTCEGCMLSNHNEYLDVNAYRKVLLPNSLNERKVQMLGRDAFVYTYKLPYSRNCLIVTVYGCNIRFEKKSN